jgi:hypothetical protein
LRFLDFDKTRARVNLNEVAGLDLFDVHFCYHGNIGYYCSYDNDGIGCLIYDCFWS